MAYLDHLDRCNAWDPARFLPFVADGRRIGWVRRDNARLLAEVGGAFRVGADRVAFAEGVEGAERRTEAVAEAADRLVARGAVPKPRDEAYAVKMAWLEPELFRVDRSLVSFLGLKAYGVHMSGYVRRADGGLDIWVGRRASDKAVAPGKLDNLVAGGQPAGLSLRDNLLKEAAEEADMAPDLAGRAVGAGAVTYCFEGALGLKLDTMYVYDIELPPDFTPRNTDGEMAEFMLWPAERVLETVRQTDDFKFNVNLVILDFAVRHGLLTPDDEPAYEALVRRLRGGHGGIGDRL